MTKVEKQLILDLSLHKISKEEFSSKFSKDVALYKNFVLESLEEAYHNRNAEDVEYSLLLGFLFQTFTDDYVDILCKLLTEDWHYKHEDIVLILEDIKSPKSVDAIYVTSLKKFDYLSYDNTFSLARKCIHALGQINTLEAREKLQNIAQSGIPILKEKAEKQLYLYNP